MEKSFVKWAPGLVSKSFLSKVSSNERRCCTCNILHWTRLCSTIDRMNQRFLLDVQNECYLSLASCLQLKWHHMSVRVSQLTDNLTVCSSACWEKKHKSSSLLVPVSIYWWHRWCFHVMTSSHNFMESLFCQFKICLNTATCVSNIMIVGV